MKLSHTWCISGVFVLVAVAVGAWLYPQLPARVPIHWNVHGQVNGWTSPFWAAAQPVLMLLGLVVLTWLLPFISPRRFEIKPFGRVYEGLMLAIQGVLLVIGMCVLLNGAGYRVPVVLISMLAVGVLLMVLGNYMGKLRKNFFIGIRSPWTLASDAVWERTHRLGGWLFMFAGIAWIALSLAGAARSVWPLLAVAILAAGVPFVYSYFIYRRLEGRHGPEGEDP